MELPPGVYNFAAPGGKSAFETAREFLLRKMCIRDSFTDRVNSLCIFQGIHSPYFHFYSSCIPAQIDFHLML